ncbi:S-locus-specific glycoprotein S6, putative [Theobroma cacao]|uniref:Receptor-like serine/threonine-protein kinase n=1 Tax=Theobroma cacao TaxID=3641 RepID=A0A061GMZ5_THECC|nr:S-locus-specific glycoprotein S6, putative [Theobroma cacao]
MGGEQRRWGVFLSSMSLLLNLLLLHCCAATNNITLSRPLSQDQILTSPGQFFVLGFFQPNNSANRYVGIWYKDKAPTKIVWVANREKPVTNSSASLTIGSDGNLKLVDGNQDALWSTNVSVPSNSSVAVLSDNGNFELIDGISGANLWQSFEHPYDTFLLGASLGYNFKTGERRFLTSWKSDSDPSPGNFVVGLLPGSTIQAFVWKDRLPYWRSGQWDKTKFIGIPEMDSSSSSIFDLREDLQQGTVYLYTNTYNQSVALNMVISSVGTLQLEHWERGQGWIVDWEAPQNPCDVYGVCGSFGVCSPSESPICSCLRGFTPKSDEEWSRGNWTGGCMRRTNLSCEENTSSKPTNTGKADRFWTMDRMKLPDLSEYLEIDSDLCQEWCMNNCSCMGYAIVYGIGCLVWTGNITDMQKFPFGGEEFFIRLAHSEFADERLKEKLIISLTTISCIIILGILVYGICRKRFIKIGKRKRIFKHFDLAGNETSSEILTGNTLRSHLELEDPSELPVFDLNSILVATDNFSITNKLGQGGFGPVYKGKLHDGKYVAVKRLSSSSGQGIEEFKNEVMLISKLQHRNLVRLFGYCIEKEERMLIYEFMANKSLDTFLFDPTKRADLHWPKRFNIIQGVARGLLYLHRDSCLRVVHRDLKVSNILLDDKMNPKISDFGLARIFQGTQLLANTHRVVGTLGYMSPEYALSGIFSEKSDVFSFGVLLLEIVNGRKITASYYHDKHISLIDYAWQLWSESKELDLLDEALADSFSSSEVTRCIHIALLCVQDHAENRPNMSAVVSMLSSEAELPRPKQPTFTFQTGFYSEKCDSNHFLSACELTESVLEGR